MTGQMRHLAAGLLGLVLGMLALGPALKPGFVLAYDMVFVPHPVFGPATFGLLGSAPRQVPSDAVVTALTALVPGDVVQKLLLLAIFMMACVSAAALVPSERLLPRLAAGACYTWNPFVAERLLIGQWAVLLGYAALPWVVRAAAEAGERGGGRRLIRALVPAAIGGFAAVLISGLTAVIVAASRGRAVGRVVPAIIVVSLPWLVTGLLRGLPADTSGVGAFAARADTPFGTLGSLLSLGGLWNAETVPSGYGSIVPAGVWLGLVVMAVAGYALWCRTAWWRGLGVAAIAGLLIAGLGAAVPGLLRVAIGLWPAFAVLRDGQQYVAPLAVLIAVGFGVSVDRMVRANQAWTAVGVLAVLAPIAVLPALAWGAAGRLHAVGYPADWANAREIIAADRTRGDVLVLPWASYRSYPWNGGRRVLDPLPRYLDRRVIWNDAVTVGTTTMGSEDSRTRALDPVIRPGGPLPVALGREGVRYVVVDAAFDRGRLAGAELLVDGPDLQLYRIQDLRPVPEPEIPRWIAVLAWIGMLSLILWSFVTPTTTLVTLFPHFHQRTP